MQNYNQDIRNTNLRISSISSPDRLWAKLLSTIARLSLISSVIWETMFSWRLSPMKDKSIRASAKEMHVLQVKQLLKSQKVISNYLNMCNPKWARPQPIPLVKKSKFFFPDLINLTITFNQFFECITIIYDYGVAITAFMPWASLYSHAINVEMR